MRLLLFSEGFIGCFSFKGPMWSVEVVEAFPFVEFGFQIDVTFVAWQLVKLLLVTSM